MDFGLAQPSVAHSGASVHGGLACLLPAEQQQARGPAAGSAFGAPAGVAERVALSEVADVGRNEKARAHAKFGARPGPAAPKGQRTRCRRRAPLPRGAIGQGTGARRAPAAACGARPSTPGIATSPPSLRARSFHGAEARPRSRRGPCAIAARS